MSDGKQKLNASQRLETLEVNMQEVSMYLNNMARDLQIIKEAIKLLGNKLDAVQRSAGISNDSVAELMMENNANELKEKVNGFIAQGVLVGSEAASSAGFIVGKELGDDGKVVNQRVQFAVAGMNPDLQAKVVGAKPGDVITFSEDTLKLEVTEVYEIVPPKQEEAPEAPAEA